MSSNTRWGLETIYTSTVRLRRVIRVLSVAGLLFSFGGVEASEHKKFAAVRTRAETLLQLLRAEQWEDAADLVLTDEVTQQRLGIPEGASPDTRTEKIAGWFEGIYGSVKPGPVFSVRLDPKDPNLALVSYRHGDLDGFNMRLVEGEWLYTLDWKPHPRE